MNHKLAVSITLLFITALTAQAATPGLATPGTTTAVVIPIGVLVGFIVRCRRKGLPFRSATKA